MCGMLFYIFTHNTILKIQKSLVIILKHVHIALFMTSSYYNLELRCVHFILGEKPHWSDDFWNGRQRWIGLVSAYKFVLNPIHQFYQLYR